MVAPQQEQIIDIWPPRGQIRDFWGNLMSVNEAAVRVNVLRGIINEMETHPEQWGAHERREIGMYMYYNDELEYLESQLNN